MNPGIKGEKFKIILTKQWDKEPIIKDKINMTKRHFTIALIFIGIILFLMLHIAKIEYDYDKVYQSKFFHEGDTITCAKFNTKAVVGNITYYHEGLSRGNDLYSKQTLFLNADRQGQVQFIGTDGCAYYVIVNKD
jgi:hypothetical protein